MILARLLCALVLAVIAAFPASAGGTISLSTGAVNFVSGGPYFGLSTATTTGQSARPWVAPQNVTVSGITCHLAAAPGAGNTLKLVPAVVTAGTTTVTDQSSGQSATISGTSLTFTYVNTTSLTLNVGDGLVVHGTATAGSLPSVASSCSFNWI